MSERVRDVDDPQRRDVIDCDVEDCDVKDHRDTSFPTNTTTSSFGDIVEKTIPNPLPMTDTRGYHHPYLEQHQWQSAQKGDVHEETGGRAWSRFSANGDLRITKRIMCIAVMCEVKVPKQRWDVKNRK